MKRLLCLLLSPLLLLLSCGDAENEYTIGACYLAFDNSQHNDAILASAMNVNSPGIFCLIKSEVQAGGATYFAFTNNAGQSSRSIINGIDQRRTNIIGYNNGVIVGFGTLDSPTVFYAYDKECPNCFDPNALPVRSKPLTMSSNGLATCKVCHRQYNMNSDGIVVAGDSGKKMTRYRASTTGPFGILAVN